MTGPQPPYGQPYGPHPQTQPMPQTGHRAPRRLPLPLLVLAIGAPALLLGAVLGVGGTLLVGSQVSAPPAASASPSSSTMPVSGTVTLQDGFGAEGLPCEGKGGYNDIREGAQVVITDAKQATLAVGALGPGKRDEKQRCEFAFSLSAPAGHEFYGIEVSHRGRLQYPADRISRPLELTLGD